MLEKLEEKFSKYEIARILGARSLQLSMDAPILLKLTKEEEEELNYDSLKIAEKELLEGVLPITVKRPLPKKSSKTVKKLSEEEIKKKLEKEEEIKRKELEKIEKNKEKIEQKIVEEIKEQGEIMQIANPEDEIEDELKIKPEITEEIE